MCVINICGAGMCDMKTWGLEKPSDANFSSINLYPELSSR